MRPPSVREFKKGDKPRFHVNEYLRAAELNITQSPDKSSLSRTARAAVLPVPTDAAGVRLVLSDQGNITYPLFHDYVSHARAGGDRSSWTLTTVLFELGTHQRGKGGRATVYHGPSAQENVLQVFTYAPV